MALGTVFLITNLWAEYRLEQILAATAMNSTVLEQYVAPSWHRLAGDVRTGKKTLPPQEQADKFDKVAKAFEFTAKSEREMAALRTSRALAHFRNAVIVFALQLVLAVVIGIAVAKRAVSHAPPN